MNTFIPRPQLWRRVTCGLTAFVFMLGSLPGYGLRSYADTLPGYMPAPGALLKTSPAFAPCTVRGIRFFKDDPFKFEFIIDSGNDKNTDNRRIKEEAGRLIKYFMAGLTIPEEDFWVNLSPYEADKIIPDALSQTDTGRDLLAEDYLLKQLVSSLTYPESELGKNFWQAAYRRAKELFGTAKIPLNTFNKVWIMPSDAEIYADNDKVFLTSVKLKVMMESDYLAMSKNIEAEGRGTKRGNLADKSTGVNPRINQRLSTSTVSDVSGQVMRELILPVIEKEVNEGKNFAALRQICYSVILAAWFKNHLKESIINKVYSDKKKTDGINLDDPRVKEKIYTRYLEAYKKGVYDYIKKEFEVDSRKQVKRRYFSGGAKVLPAAGTPEHARVTNTDGPVSPAIAEKVSPDLAVTAQLVSTPGKATASASAIRLTDEEIGRAYRLFKTLGIINDADGRIRYHHVASRGTPGKSPNNRQGFAFEAQYGGRLIASDPRRAVEALTAPDSPLLNLLYPGEIAQVPILRNVQRHNEETLKQREEARIAAGREAAKSIAAAIIKAIFNYRNQGNILKAWGMLREIPMEGGGSTWQVTPEFSAVPINLAAAGKDGETRTHKTLPEALAQIKKAAQASWGTIPPEAREEAAAFMFRPKEEAFLRQIGIVESTATGYTVANDAWPEPAKQFPINMSYETNLDRAREKIAETGLNLYHHGLNARIDTFEKLIGFLEYLTETRPETYPEARRISMLLGQAENHARAGAYDQMNIALDTIFKMPKPPALANISLKASPLLADILYAGPGDTERYGKEKRHLESAQATWDRHVSKMEKESRQGRPASSAIPAAAALSGASVDIENLQSPYADIRSRAAQNLYAATNPALARAYQAIADGQHSDIEREEIIHSGGTALPALRAALKDALEETRILAAEILHDMRTNDPETISALVEAFDDANQDQSRDKNEHFHPAAEYAIMAADQEAVRRALGIHIGTLERRLIAAREPGARTDLAQRIITLEDLRDNLPPVSRPSGVGLRIDPAPLMSEASNADIQRALGEGRITPEQLEDLQNPDTRVRTTTAQALAKAGVIKSYELRPFELLAKLAGQRNGKEAESTAAELLIYEDHAIPALLLALRDNDTALQRYAILSLGSVGHEDSRIDLRLSQMLAESDSEQTREVIIRALQQRDTSIALTTLTNRLQTIRQSVDRNPLDSANHKILAEANMIESGLRSSPSLTGRSKTAAASAVTAAPETPGGIAIDTSKINMKTAGTASPITAIPAVAAAGNENLVSAAGFTFNILKIEPLTDPRAIFVAAK